MKYANVSIDINSECVDRPFQYEVPEEILEKLSPGVQVFVPFGKGNAKRKAFVLELTDEVLYDPTKIKKIIDVVPGSITLEGERLALATFMKKNYGSTLYAALRTVLPIQKKVAEQYHREIRCLLTEEERNALVQTYEEKHFSAKARTLSAFRNGATINRKTLQNQYNISSTCIDALIKDNILTQESHIQYRNPMTHGDYENKPICLNDEQTAIVQRFSNDYMAEEYHTYLLHGVTGSGKTECYMEMMQCVLNEGRQVILLIPEIALTNQNLKRFYDRFGDRVSILHSKLSNGERYDQMVRARNGEVDIMIGPRSALFTPFENLGLIIMDEEHETSYKSDTMPRYHAREVAERIASDMQAALILGSATPSIQSYYKMKTGEYQLLKLTKRYSDAKLPNVQVVDLKEELHQGNKSIFSRELMQKMQERFEKGEQIMLFLNRRGYTSFLSCRSCGYIAKCPHCDVPLTKHINGQLECHYCGYYITGVNVCPSCSSKYFGGFRAGTQQVEESVYKFFPKARVLRMDADTTRKKGGYDAILNAFRNQEADILIGTQMIVKGHDFPNVTLVGVLAADLSLGANDYTAAERTFQLLTQAVGRAGRGQKIGEAIIQTYQPEHYAVSFAAKQDYEGFYEEEIGFREIMEYPPVAPMLAVLIKCKNEEHLEQKSIEIANIIKSTDHEKKLRILGPVNATVSKINDIFRKVLYIRANEYGMLVKTKDAIENHMEKNESNKYQIQIIFDFNPMNGY